MTIKYKREDFRGRSSDLGQRYNARSSRFGGDPRRRLLIIYLGLGIASIVILGFHFVTQNQLNRWLPTRMGDGVVVDKGIENEGTEQARYTLSVKVTVPAASPSEEKFVAANAEDRTARIGELEMTGNVSTDALSWRAVEKGTALRVGYQIDMQRTRIIVRSILLEEEPVDEE